ncbi:MAG: hypothetical protein RL518_2273 [Pseudomonadota bacterium]|jgi:hypothetical protein
MRYLSHLALAAALSLIYWEAPAVFAATKCVYNPKTLTGEGCPENYKCSPRGECEVAFTISEIKEAVAPAVNLPAGYSPPPLFTCDGTNGWGMVNGLCLPTCENLAQMWLAHLTSLNINPQKEANKNYHSYIENKASCPYKPIPDVLTGCVQGVIANVYTPPALKGKVCCAKFCTSPYGPSPADYPPVDYSKIPAPYLGDPAAPPVPAPGAAPVKPGEVPLVTLGPPLNPITGKPLPSGPDPFPGGSGDKERPFGNGPAPKKRR